MAWVFDAGRIAAGQTVVWQFWWDTGNPPPLNRPWNGIQVTAAKPIGREGEYQFDSRLRVSSPTVEWSLAGYVYRIAVTNEGPADTAYEIWGAGL